MAILREQRVRLREEERQASRLSNADASLDAGRSRLMSAARSQEKDREMARQEREDASAVAAFEPRVVDSDAGETSRAVLSGVLGPIAIAVLDGCFIGAASQFILSLVYAPENGEQPWWTLVVVAPALFTFELWLSGIVSALRQEVARNEPGARVRLWLAIAVAAVLALVVPILATATMMQAIENGGVSGAAGTALTIVVIGIGACLHASVLFFGNRSVESIVFLRNKSRYQSHLGRAGRLDIRANRGREHTVDRLRDYHGAHAMRAALGPVPDHLVLTSADGRVVNAAVGEPVVRIAEPAPENATPGARRNAVHDAAEPAEANPTPDDLSAENEFLRRAMRGEQANVDGEIT